MENQIQSSWNFHEGSPIKCIMDVSKNARRLLADQMEPRNISGIQGRILSYIIIQKDNGKEVCQKDIESMFRIPKSSVTETLQKLEQKGYIYRMSEKTDARKKNLYLSEEGLRYMESNKERLHVLEGRVRSALTPEEFEQFLTYMRKLDDKISEVYRQEECYD